jgi:hypothetical protein
MGPGKLIAHVLCGAWRRSPPPLGIDAEQLESISPLLLGSSAGSLGWWKVRGSPLAITPAGQRLQAAYNVYCVENVVRRQTLKTIVPILRSDGIEPILVKGWAAASSYPDPGLRPYMDIDLVVPPGLENRAGELMRAHKIRNVDFEHWELTAFDDRRYRDLYERSRLLDLDGIEVRVPGPEDHLRLMCIHLLKHGGTRPIWFCDIGAAIEMRPPNFDWDRLTGNDHRKQWIAYTIVLAHRLLGVAIGDTPFVSWKIPHWMEKSILHDWSTPRRILSMKPVKIIDSMQGPAAIIHALQVRWPNPIQITVANGERFSGGKAFLLQLRHCVRMMVRFLDRYPIALQETPPRSDSR